MARGSQPVSFPKNPENAMGVLPLEEAGGGRRAWIRGAVVVSGVIGVCVGAAAHRRFGATLVKVESELGDVSKMLQENAQQFSLGAYTEDAEVRTPG